MTGRHVQVRRLITADDFRSHVSSLGVELPFDPAPDVAGLSAPFRFGPLHVGNRFAILPMEGWDGTARGGPTDLVRRRWRRFGRSGAKLIWGGEATAVRYDGRANPRQLVLTSETAGGIEGLRDDLVREHRGRFGSDAGLVVGLQLTHSGRWARPDGQPRPRIAYRHPVLDARVGADETSLLTDAELDDLVGDFVRAARLAREIGFDFVDVKCCHGYLGHELLSAHTRPGLYGGDLSGRSRFVCSTVEAIRASTPDLPVGVRLSLFDFAPHDSEGEGGHEAGRFAFGGDGTGAGVDLSEPNALLEALAEAGAVAVCVSAGSPYYCPHVQRPAYFPPSDGYPPPEDPLVGVARLVEAAAAVKARHPRLAVVGSGYSYLQEWLAHVASAVVTRGGVDAVGIGRMALSYPDLPARTSSPGSVSTGDGSAARSAIARRRHATVSSRAAIHSTSTTATCPAGRTSHGRSAARGR